MKRTAYIIEGVLQVLIGAGAIICGAMLIIAPDGRLLQMSPEMLKNSPFQSFLIPGIILLLVNGAGNATSAILCFRMNKLGAFTGMILGFALILWIFVQVNMIGGGHWLQHLYFGLGIAVLIVGIVMRELERKN